MEAALDHAPCYYFSYTEDGKLNAINKTLCERLGYAQEELVGNPADTIFTLSTRIFQQTHFFPLLRMQGHAAEIFITLQTKDKEHVAILVNAVRRDTGERSYYEHVGIEVQHRKEFEEELIAARNAAEKALSEHSELIRLKEELQQHIGMLDRQMQQVIQQNEELREISRVVTHDLQEPMRKLSVFSEMMQTANTANQATVAGRLMRVLQQMRNTVTGLQQYVWLTEQSIKREELDIQKLIADIRPGLSASYPDVELEISMEEAMTVYADRAQLSLLLDQVLSNAVRFRKEGMPAMVHIRSYEIVRNRLRNIAGKYQYHHYLKLSIEDSGIGFDPRYNDQVFGLFRRLHPNSGVGIGLSLCRQVMANHQGEISMDSKEGEGTRLSLLFPMPVKDLSTASAAEAMLVLEK